MERELLERSEGRHVFGRDPAGYDRGRPGHPERVYEILSERCGLGPGTSVLEIGPGTGQATRRLLALGADPIVVVEPDPALAEYLPSVTKSKPRILNLTLEEAHLQPDSFDLAVAASSFHWVDPDVGLAAILRALRPSGWWAMWWTLFGDLTRPDPFREALDPLMKDLPMSPGGRGFSRDAELARTALAEAGFDAAQHDVVRWSARWDPRGIRELFATFSPIARLDDSRREAILDEVERVAAEDFGGVVEKPIHTMLYTARKPD